jgi:hypothetical protein
MKIDCFCCLTIRTFLPYHLTWNYWPRQILQVLSKYNNPC